jgi:hypothetical protein
MCIRNLAVVFRLYWFRGARWSAARPLGLGGGVRHLTDLIQRQAFSGAIKSLIFCQNIQSFETL